MSASITSASWRVLRHGLLALVAPVVASCQTATFVPVVERIDPVATMSADAHLATEPMLRLGDEAFAGGYTGVATDAGGRYVVTASSDKTAKIWSIDGRLLLTLRPPSGDGPVGDLNQAAFSPDASVVAIGWRGPKGAGIYLFDRATGHVRRHLDGLPNLTSGLRFSPNGTQLGVALVSGGVLLFDVASGREIGRDVAYGGDSYGLDFSSDGRRLVVTSFDGGLHAYGVGPTGMTRLGVVPAGDGGSLHSKPLLVRFSPDGRWLAVGFRRLGGIAIHDATTLRYSSTLLALDLRSNVFALDWTSDGASICGNVFLSSSTDSVMRCWTHGDLRKQFPWNTFEASTRDTPVHGHSGILFGPIALPSGAMLLAMQNQAWGVVDAAGAVDWRHAPNVSATGLLAISPMRPPTLALSADGSSVVAGNLFDDTAPRIEFDVDKRQLRHGAPVPPTPRLAAPGIAFNADDVYGQGGRAPVLLNGHALSLNPSERVTSVAADARGEFLALSTTEDLRLYDRDARLRWHVPGMVLAVNVSENGRWVVSRGTDQIIRWFRARDGALALSLYVDADNDRWVTWTPSGYFDASPGAEDLVGWQINQGLDSAAVFYPLSRFRARFQRPDVIARTLQADDERQALAQADAVSQRVSVPEPIAKVLPPTVEILDAPKSFDSPDVQIRVLITTNGDAPVEQIRVMVNGKFEPNARGKIRALDGEQTLHLSLARKDAAIDIIAGNRYAFSEPRHLALTYRPGADTSTQRVGASVHKPKLFVLAIGVSDYRRSSMNLAYAGADARDFAHLFDGQRGHHYAAVTTRVLTDKDATREHVLAGLKWLREVQAESDVGIVFLAGHGEQMEDGSYHFATTDFDPADVRGSSIDDAAIRDALGAFSARGNDALLFVDTCHAGGVVSSTLQESSGDANNRLLRERENNVVVFAASSGNQLAYEDKDWGHGAFTRVLIDALGSWKADPYQSGEITHADLSAYVQKFLPSLTQQRQIPRVFTPLGEAAPFVVVAR